jgi:uncharacterized protein YggT (Ycf19 family)
VTSGRWTGASVVEVMPATPAPGPPTSGPPSSGTPVAVPDPSSGDAKVGILRVARGVVLFIYAVVIVDLVILGLGFVLRLFGASTDASFTRWVYRNVDRIMEPFRGMFPTHPVSDRSVIDFSLLFAMIVYTIIAMALHALVLWLASKITEIRRRDRRARLAARGAVSPTAMGPGGGTYVEAADPAARPYA